MIQITMNESNALFLIPLMTGAIIAVVGLITYLFPPKKINGLYGYRTSSSMANQESWDFAQSYSSKEMMKWGVVLFAFSIFGLLFELGETAGTVLGLSMMLIIIIIVIYRVEKALKRKFGP